MRKKLDMRHHKALLTITIFVLFIIAFIFAGYLANAASEIPVLAAATFSLVFVVFIITIITISMLIRTRDEIHAMHEENRQRFQNVHERVNSVHAALVAKTRKR